MPAILRLSSLRLALFALLPFALASCGGGGGGGGFSFFPFPPGDSNPPPAAEAKYTVGGNVSGLLGSGLVLQLAGSADVAVAANGAFVFSEKRAKGTSYAVSVKQQPATPAQTCTVNNATGTIGDADVANVAVVCAVASHKVSVTVTNLDAAGGLVLQNNGGDDLAVNANGTFSFTTPVAAGADYGVTVKTQPTALQVCIARQAFGTVTTGPITSVTVACTTPGANSFAFTADEGSKSVSMYTVDSNGSLTNIGNFPLNGTPQHVTTHPSKPYIYVSNYTGATKAVIQYTIDPSAPPSGTLTQQRIITAGVGTSPYFVGISPNGQHAYVIGDGMLRSLDVDANTGELTGGTAIAGGSNRKVGLDPQGRFAFVVNGSSLDAYRLDPNTGAPISPPASVVLPAPSGLADIAIEPTGRFAYANVGINPGTLLAYSIDATTGALTQIGSVPSGNTPFGMAVDPSGRFLYAANRNSNDVSAYRIDPKTGMLTPVPGQPFAVTGNVPNSVTVDRTGRFAYTANQADNTITFFTIDRTTGALGTGVNLTSTGNGPQFLALSN